MSQASTSRMKSTQAHRIRRTTARTLHGAASLADNIAALVAIVIAVTSLFGIGPAWAQRSTTGVVLLVLAAFGAARLSDQMLTDIADAIDPDSYDGDRTFLAATVLRDVASDVDNGADLDDVRIAIQDSRVLAELRDLLSVVALHQIEEQQELEANAFNEAAEHVEAAARTLGDKQL